MICFYFCFCFVIDVLFRAKCKQGNFQLQQQSSAHMHRKSISAAQKEKLWSSQNFWLLQCCPLHANAFLHIKFWICMLIPAYAWRSTENRHAIYICTCTFRFFVFVIFSNFVYATVRAYVINLAVSQTISILKGLGAVPICVCKAMWECVCVCGHELRGYFRGNQCHERSKQKYISKQRQSR